jgi:hypothetical protein
VFSALVRDTIDRDVLHVVTTGSLPFSARRLNEFHYDWLLRRCKRTLRPFHRGVVTTYALEIGAAGDGDYRYHSFSAFRAVRCSIHEMVLPILSPTTNWNFCSNRACWSPHARRQRKLGFRPPATCTYASWRSLAAPDRLANLKPPKLRMIQIQRLILPCSIVRCPKRLRLGPSFKYSTVFPNRVRSMEGVILSLRALERVKLYKARNLVEMTVARRLEEIAP